MFEGLDIEDQAYLFSVINTKQTPINPSLAQDLYAYAKIETPQKLAHTLTMEFNSKDTPWKHRIKRLGKVGPYGEEIISQSTFAKEIIKLICDVKDNYAIRDILKRNHNNRLSLENFYNNKDKFIFWEPYMQGKDGFIFQALLVFFSAVYETYPNEWKDKNSILLKTTGYSAMMRIFRDLYLIGKGKKDLQKPFFIDYFNKTKKSKKRKKLIVENYPPGVRGEVKLYKDWHKSMGLTKRSK